MRNDRYADSPITTWGYVGYNLLWTVPVIGWIFWIGACFSEKTNRRCYARSFFVMFFVAIFAFLLIAILFAYGWYSEYNDIYPFNQLLP